MQLGQAEPLSIFDDHQRGIRNINTDLNDGGSNKQINFPGLEGLHDVFFFARFESAVNQPYSMPWQRIAQSAHCVFCGFCLQ